MLQDERLQKKEQVIEYLRRFPFYKWAAKSIGRDEDTLLLWRNEDRDFSDKCELAKSEAVATLGKRATPDFMLKSVDPETFKERVDVTSGNKPIPILGAINVSTNDSNKEITTTE